MKILATKTLTWWQVGIIKIASALFGIAIGAYWADIFAPYVCYILVAGIITGAYAGWMWFKA
jgi:hypothetical protein